MGPVSPEFLYTLSSHDDPEVVFTCCHGYGGFVTSVVMYQRVVARVAMVITHVAMVLQVGADPDPSLSGRAGADAVHPGTTRGPW